MDDPAMYRKLDIELTCFRILFLIISSTALHLLRLSSGPSSSLHYLGHIKIPRLIDRLTDDTDSTAGAG